MDEKDIIELKTNVAVILATCQNIEGDVGKINDKLENHEKRIRALEVWQGGEKVRAAITGVFATIAGGIAGFLGK